MNGPAQVRPAAAADLQALVRIHLAAYAGRRSAIAAFGADMIEATYDWFVVRGSCLIAMHNGAPAGLAAFYRQRQSTSFSRHGLNGLLRYGWRKPAMVARLVGERLRDQNSDRGGDQVASPGDIIIYSLAVSPEHGGAGVGRELLSSIAARLSPPHEAGSGIWASVGADNFAAQRLYGKAGYRIAYMMPGTGQIMMLYQPAYTANEE
jgi:ribosomal protein S18 acetylase RimI-like enzyme